MLKNSGQDLRFYSHKSILEGKQQKVVILAANSSEA